MKNYETKLLDAALHSGALRFGDFLLRSGRKSPYFYNSMMMSDGDSFGLQCSAYADKLVEVGHETFDVIFGPAYKGIPLSAGTAIQLSSENEINKRFAFDRKVPKPYGDSADRYVNGKLQRGDRIMIIDDVITTGEKKREEIKLLNSLNMELKVVGILVGLNRDEVDDERRDPVGVFQRETGIPVHHILDARSMFESLYKKNVFGKVWVGDYNYKAFQDYYSRYGAKHEIVQSG